MEAGVATSYPATVLMPGATSLPSDGNMSLTNTTVTQSTFAAVAINLSNINVVENEAEEPWAIVALDAAFESSAQAHLGAPLPPSAVPVGFLMDQNKVLSTIAPSSVTSQ
jgi:hypothetical protein